MKHIHTFEEFLNEANKFKSTKDFLDFLEEIDGMKEGEIRKIMGKDYIDTPGNYKKEAKDYDNDIEEYMISNMGKGEFEKLLFWWGKNVQESIVNEDDINESTINQFKPILDRTNQIDERIFKKLMPKTEKTSEEAMKRILTFEGNTMFAHYQYNIVKPNGNKPDRPTYRLHDIQYWLNDTQMKMQGRDPKESVNVTLVTVYDITDPMKEQNLGKIYVDTDTYLDEMKRSFELIKQVS